MEEQELSIIELEDEFNKQWMNNHLRNAGVFGPIQDKLIPVKSGGYILPNALQRIMEPYIVHLYKQAAGDNEIVSSQEIYYIKADKVQLQAKAMVETCSTSGESSAN